jgi:flagellar basal body-associated protein FliL
MAPRRKLSRKRAASAAAPAAAPAQAEPGEQQKKLAIALVVVAILLAGGIGVYLATRPGAHTSSSAGSKIPVKAPEPLNSLIEIKRGISSPAYTPKSTPGWPSVQVSDGALKLSGGSNTSGNYVQYPPLTVNLSKGFTIIVSFRFNKSVDWQRILDLGNGPEDHTKNIVLCQNGEMANAGALGMLRFGIRRGKEPLDEDVVEVKMDIGKIQTAIARYDPDRNQLSLEVRGTSNSFKSVTPPTKYTAVNTLNTNYIGKSNWSQDSYSNLDIFSMLVVNSLFTDSQVESTLKSNT